MPPDTPSIPGDNAHPNVRVVSSVPAPFRAMASFFDLEGFGAAHVASSYSRMEQINRLIAIERTAEDEGTKLRAIALHHQIGKDLLDLNGLTATLKEKRTHVTDDGQIIQQVAERRTLARLLENAGNIPSADAPTLEGVTVRPPTGPTPGDPAAH